MFFRKRIERRCGYCVRAAKLDDDLVLCSKKGIRTESGKCFRFRYDPCKRIPVKAKALDFAKYDREDFSL